MLAEAYTKNRLLEGINIRVYWKFEGKVYSGILLDKVFVHSEIPVDEEGFTGPEKPVQGYEWEIQGDDGHFYGIPEKQLHLSNIELEN